jgi:branched-chain amino acid transport system ATP-binding protein
VSLLATEQLSRQFDGVHAVEAVDFLLTEGEVRAVIGPNGAGKTTFVSLVAGRLRPSAGRILFDGRDITALPAHRRVALGIAYTFQITSVFGNLTAFANVAIAAQNTLQRRGERAEGEALTEAARAALDAVGLAGRAQTRAGDLAYGHQRLLEVAMGLALAPKLLILDEPTQGLSDEETGDFCALIRSLAGATTVLLIEHNMDVVMALAQTITVMAEGRVLAEGTPEEIRADAAVQRAYLGG